MPAADEYKQLRDEIGRNSQVTQNVFVASATVTAALIGYGLNSVLGTVFMAPFAILIPSVFFLTSQLESTTRIAAYIVVFLEAESVDLKWETRWLRLRELGLLPRRRKYTLALSGLYGLLGLVCLYLAHRYWPYSLKWYVITATPIGILYAWGISTLATAFSLRLVQVHVEAWQRLRSSEQTDAA
jgi:hypothetical protein